MIANNLDIPKMAILQKFHFCHLLPFAIVRQYKAKHTGSMVDIDGFNVHRRNRVGSRGGGVALYVASTLRSSRWTPSVDINVALEIEWVNVEARTFFAASIIRPSRYTDRKCCLTTQRCASRKSATTSRWQTLYSPVTLIKVDFRLYSRHLEKSI